MSTPAPATDFLHSRLEPLRQKIMAASNEHCFIERQEIMAAVALQADRVPPEFRYTYTLEQLLDRLSTPIEAEDVFLGRMVEGAWEQNGDPHQRLPFFSSPGHTTLDWPTLLNEGLEAVAKRARQHAETNGDRLSRIFANNVERCCAAVIRFSRRYAAAARNAALDADESEREHLLRLAAGMEQAPAGPATDLLNALQAVWLIQFVTSCVIGSRDFAYGRIDQYLLPFYERGIADGSLTPDRASLYLAHLFVKSKEITGTATDNYQTKPTPCHASNQYAIIGGVTPDGEEGINALSYRVLEAITLADVPQPEINVRIDPDSPLPFKEACARAIETSAPQVQFWNDRAILDILAEHYPQVPLADARDYALTACNRINFPGRENITGGEHWHVMPRWLLAALDQGRDPVSGESLAADLPPLAEIDSLDDLLTSFERIARQQVGAAVRRATEHTRQPEPHRFHFESALLDDCLERSLDARGGGTRYPTQFHLFGGVATVTDSLMAIQKLVFEERRYALADFAQITRDDYVGHEPLRQELLNRIPRFGNDQPEADELAHRVSLIAFDALSSADNPDTHLLFPALYSLHHHMHWGRELPATTDGRRAGDPLSENQSPVHGADRAGLSALLNSAARLPHDRAPMGGLNIRFGGKLPPAQFIALLDTFFAQGGVTVGYTQIDRATLLAARENPEQYRSLCVRVTGFSEYFVALSPAGQQDIIDRTEY
jgi:trans-4-hydroxy-L-proline dehydratase